MSTMIHQSAFSILTNIKSDEAITALKKHFEDTSQGTHTTALPFGKLKTVHFARMFIVDQLHDVKDELVRPARLVFTSNFDGPVDVQMAHMCDVAANELDAIYQYCEGYPEPTMRNKKSRMDFFNKYNEGTNLFWAADIGGTVDIIQKEAQLYDFIQEKIDVNQLEWQKKSPAGVHEAIKNEVKNSPFKWALTPRPKASFGYKFKRVVVLFWKFFVLFLGIGVLASPSLLLRNVLPSVPIWILAIGSIVLSIVLILMLSNYMVNRAQKKLAKKPPKVRNLDKVLSSEDLQFQNQLTIYGTIDKPYWFRKTILQVGLWLFRFNGGYRATKGVLSGITTIHFARWVLFDNNNYIMFLSNYDGGWESYLSEFIDNASQAMNLTFGQTYGYPRVKNLINDGAQDEQVFKYVVRQHQYPCVFFYSAYPNLTIKNIINNKGIRAGLSTSLSGKKLDEWLHRL